MCLDGLGRTGVLGSEERPVETHQCLLPRAVSRSDIWKGGAESLLLG